MDIIYLLIGIIISGIVGVIIVRSLKQQLNEVNLQLQTANEKGELQRIEQLQALENKQNEINQLKVSLATADANSGALADKLKTQKDEFREMQVTAHLQFEKIAAKIFEEKSGKFTEVNQKNIEAILKPLGENIDSFKKKVEETFTDETKQRASLDERIKNLVEQTNKVSSEANNLASALKGKSKTQGNWGEMILESILQQSGLEKNREYFAQQSHTNEDGKRLQPDILVNLPDNRTIIIDSKVSLTAYERFSSAEANEEQQMALAEHLKSIRAHVEELSKKKYDDLDKSLDFVMMFVPIEPAYLLAMQNDPSLWSDAYSKRILLISPTNLIACLKIIADLWKREMQSKNAQEIVEQGEKMYEKFVGFLESMDKIGNNIRQTQDSYEKAVAQLNTGRGNLISRAEKMKQLGLKSSKAIPTNLRANDDYEDEIVVLPIISND
jgi:DNA recombination protein RmuC